MQSFLLDTSVCVFLLRGNQSVIDEIKRVGIQNCYISEITKAELLYGAQCSSKPEFNTYLVDSLCNNLKNLCIDNCLATFAVEKAKLRKDGKLIEDFDLLIGATALTYDMTLITDNIKHFERLPIKLVNWIKR